MSKRRGIQWYLFVSAMILLCISCITSLVLCLLVTKQVMHSSMQDNYINEMAQIDSMMEQSFFRGKRRIESIGNDIGIRRTLAELEDSSALTETYRLMEKMEFSITSNLFGAGEISSFYLVTTKGIIAIDDKYIGSRIIIADYPYDNIYEALQNNFEQFISTYTHPQQRLFQPVGKIACLVGIVNYSDTLQSSHNIMVESKNEGILYTDLPFSDAKELNAKLPKGAELIFYTSPTSNRTYSQLVSSAEVSQYWFEQLRIIIPISLFVVCLSGWFLYVYSRRIGQPILQFRDILSMSGSNNFHEIIKAYASSFRNSPGLRMLVFRYYIFSLVPVILLIFTYTAVYQQSLYNNLTEQAEKRMQLVEQNIHTELNEYLYLARFISFDQDIQNELLLINKSDNAFEADTDLPKLLLSRGVLGKGIVNVVFYNENFLPIYNRAESIRDEELSIDTWRSYFSPKSMQVWWDISDKRESIFTMVWRVRYLPGTNKSALVPRQARAFLPLGYVRFDIKNLFDNIAGSIRSNLPLHYAIVDQKGEYVIRHGLPQHLRLVNEIKIENTPWNLRLYVDQTEIWWESLFSLAPNLWVMILSVGAMLLVCQLLTRQIKSPMNYLQNGILHDDIAALTAVHEISSINEFSMFANSFEDMLTRMEAMNEELLQNRVKQIQVEKREKEAELTALQMQISPHFLYNIFSSIQFLLMDKDIDQATSMIKAVGEFMRVGIYRGSHNVTLETELKHAEAYVRLQRLRYGTKLLYTSNIEDELRDIHIPRFIIQPLIENPIEHGFPRKRPLEIQLDVNRNENGWIELSVSDNGMGIQQETIEHIEKTVRAGIQHEHIGLVNVYERLRLYFGENSIFEIKSTPDVKTVVKLIFEYKKRE